MQNWPFGQIWWELIQLINIIYKVLDHLSRRDLIWMQNITLLDVTAWRVADPIPAWDNFYYERMLFLSFEECDFNHMVGSCGLWIPRGIRIKYLFFKKSSIKVSTSSSIKGETCSQFQSIFLCIKSKTWSCYLVFCTTSCYKRLTRGTTDGFEPL